MDGPVPPRDSSLRNIIDKLAEFVARNGPEFEMITKQKQHGNPKFEFLYGGEYAGYYQYRVAAEQSFLKQQGSLPPQASHPAHHALHQQPPTVQHFSTAPPIHIQQQQQQSSINDETAAASAFGGMNQIPPSNHMWNANPKSGTQQTNGSSLAISLTAQIEASNMQQNSLREQIHQSESNLSAQHSALMAQQNKQIDEAIEAAQNTQMEKIAEDNSISLKEFNAILQPIIESCTKDSISSGKNWILQHSSDSAKNNVVLQYLLKKALVNGSTFQQKLHLIYLVNDILHHCVRKNSHDLKNSLENVVIPMFCSADLIASSDQRAKLTKLLSLWESKAKFFDACVISKLKSPDSSMQEYKTNLQNLHHEIVTKFTQTTKSTLDNYQKQHQIFIQHATQQITQLEQQKQQLEQQMLASVLPNTSMMPPQIQQQQQQPQQQQLPQPHKIPALMSQKISMPGADDLDHMKPPGVDDNNYSDNRYQHQQQSQQQQQQNNVFSMNANFQQSQLQQQPQTRTHHNPFASAPSSAADTVQQSNFFIPDLSKPPPGFMNAIGSIAGATQQIPSLQQQFAQLSNSTSNANNVTATVIADKLKASTASNLAVDLMALNAAIQLVQQQQQQQHHNQAPHQLDLLAATDDDDLPPPAPPMYDDVAPPAPPMYDEEPQKPSAPYYDLPAGLMVPLIRLEDYNYKPLDPEEIRIPPTAPQNERLTNALAAFYAPPTHDRPRDTEGWEKLGLYEYYKVKNAAKKQKEDEIQSGTREKSRSPTPILVDKPKPKKTNKRSYRSKSRSRSRSRSPYRSRSRSPPAVRSSRRNSGRYNRNRSPRRSPQRERGNDRNERERDSSNSSNRENRAERNNTRRERERSVTPPSFFGSNLAKANEFIEESNKGHQMLMKMGWAGTGTGLGTKSQGIDQPISGGEVRDRKDLYKGVGVNLNDPFENFRKNKGAAFVVRMRARDEKS